MTRRRGNKSNSLHNLSANDRLAERRSRDAKRQAKSANRPRSSKRPEKPSKAISGIKASYDQVNRLGITHGVLCWPTDQPCNLGKRLGQLRHFLAAIGNLPHTPGSTWDPEDFLEQLFSHFADVQDAYPGLRNVWFHPGYMLSLVKSHPYGFLAAMDFSAPVEDLDTNFMSSVDSVTAERYVQLHIAGRAAYDMWPDEVSEVPEPVLQLLLTQLMPYPFLTGSTLQAIADQISISASTDLATTTFVNYVIKRTL